MNIQANLRKIYNRIRRLQIPEDDITADNYGQGAYFAGMLDSAKLFMKLYNGELTETQIEIELAKLEPTESVN